MRRAYSPRWRCCARPRAGKGPTCTAVRMGEPVSARTVGQMTNEWCGWREATERALSRLRARQRTDRGRTGADNESGDASLRPLEPCKQLFTAHGSSKPQARGQEKVRGLSDRQLHSAADNGCGGDGFADRPVSLRPGARRTAWRSPSGERPATLPNPAGFVAGDRRAAEALRREGNDPVAPEAGARSCRRPEGVALLRRRSAQYDSSAGRRGDAMPLSNWCRTIFVQENLSR